MECVAVLNQSTSARAAFKSLFVLALAIGLAACASGPDIRVDGDPNVNIPAYRTFGFFSSVATDKAGYSTILTTRLKDATRRELEKHGYVYAESDPELLINFNLNVVDKTEIYSTPGSTGYGYYGYRSGMYGGWAGYPPEIESRNYRQGTLGIDVVDAAKKALVWQGVAEARVTKKMRENPGNTLDTIVTEILASFPAKNAVSGQPAR
ncbi:MAG: hypothetical protein QG595_1906 [Pseudomonadota bacterium]|jgi:hypothetical protein|nr:hypothetical protein [Pseudomonadota bacterium]